MEFLKGIFIGVCLVCFIAAVRVSQKYSTPLEIEREFLNVYEYLQDRQFRVEKSTPDLSRIEANEVFFIKDNGTRFCIKIGTKIYTTDMR